MVRQPDATMQPTSQDDQLMSQHRVLGFESQLRLEWRGEDGQNETEPPDHSANLGDSITTSTRMRISVLIGLLGWTAPDGIACARMRSLQISLKGDRRWNRLAELGWIRRNASSNFTG